jgi:Family of unknown function (DUF6444)
MRREPPLPQELWDQIPPHIQAAIWVMVDGYERRLAALEAEVAELKGRLNQNSQNSSRPPSSDGPHVKRKPPRAPSGRRRGGQPGHPVHQRALLPPEEVDEVVVCKPTHCRRCNGALHGGDAAPLRHQVIGICCKPVAVLLTHVALCCRIATLVGRCGGGLQGRSLPEIDHPVGREVVRGLPDLLPATRRDDAGARCFGGSLHAQSLGHQVRPRD